MFNELPKELLGKEMITEDQFKKIEPILSGKLVSLFYELRILLYLGVMLFTSGVGILIYQNIGQLGHVLSIISLCVVMLVCFWYVMVKRLPYANIKVQAPTPYFDYILLLACLLFIAIQGYLQYQYGILNNNLALSTLISALFFFVIAYRFDHIGVLSLAITALASFWSISLSPQKWYSGNFFSDSSHLYVTAIIFSSIVAALAILLDRRSIKTHFTFTYINFCSLIFLSGAITGMFLSEHDRYYLLLLYVGCGLSIIFANWKRSFLFLLYAFLFGYIGTTYFLGVTIFSREPYWWFYYSILSCGGFVFFIIKYKNYFATKS